MNWIEIIGLIGVGSVITTVLNIFWLPKIMEKIEKRKWLRDKQLKAFSKLSKEILSFRSSKGVSDYKGIHEFRGIAAESIILIEDIEIKNKIDTFIELFDEVFHIASIGGVVPESKSDKLLEESHSVVDSLSSLLMNNKQKSWIKRLFKRKNK